MIDPRFPNPIRSLYLSRKKARRAGFAPRDYYSVERNLSRASFLSQFAVVGEGAARYAASLFTMLLATAERFAAEILQTAPRVCRRYSREEKSLYNKDVSVTDQEIFELTVRLLICSVHAPGCRSAAAPAPRSVNPRRVRLWRASASHPAATRPCSASSRQANAAVVRPASLPMPRALTARRIWYAAWQGPALGENSRVGCVRVDAHLFFGFFAPALTRSPQELHLLSLAGGRTALADPPPSRES